MFAEVYFKLEKAENQIQIPNKTILTRGNEQYVILSKIIFH
ncbi:hypothetical protein N752_27020 [Desulforamulus aquiferis]|nr:hypothetical protein N752_27020 [Desulforamulus aquiferis]